MNIDDLREIIGARAGDCRSCGKKVLFAMDDKGTKQILDLVAPCFVVEWTNGTMVVRRVPVTYVSHFATCPNASQHSKRNQP